MHFSTIAMTVLFGAATMAVPAFRRSPLCLGIESSPECCAVNALGVADLNCAPRTSCLPLLSIRPRLYSYTFLCYEDGSS